MALVSRMVRATVITWLLVYVKLTAAGATCLSDIDCQLNGVCQEAGLCQCDKAWTGVDCSVLNLLPAKQENGYGGRGSNHSSWGGGAVWDPVIKRYVMVVDEFSNGCGLLTWKSNSRCDLTPPSKPQPHCPSPNPVGTLTPPPSP